MPEGSIWVLAGSPSGYDPGTIQRLGKPSRVIAANGGSVLAAKLGIVPDLVIGDLDSADPLLISRWEQGGVEMRRYGHTTKSETDTELALLIAARWLDEQHNTIYVLGGTGGRLDHSLANVLLLTHPELVEVDVRLVEGTQEVMLAKPQRWNHIEAAPGQLLSLLPVGDDVTGITLEGCVYPLSSETLAAGRGRGVSNEIVAANARLWFDTGLLLVVVSQRETG